MLYGKFQDGHCDSLLGYRNLFLLGGGGGGGGGGVVMSLIPPTKLWFNPTYHPGDRVCRKNSKMTATPIIFSFGIKLLD